MRFIISISKWASFDQRGSNTKFVTGEIFSSSETTLLQALTRTGFRSVCPEMDSYTFTALFLVEIFRIVVFSIFLLHVLLWKIKTPLCFVDIRHEIGNWILQNIYKKCHSWQSNFLQFGRQKNWNHFNLEAFMQNLVKNHDLRHPTWVT